MSWRVLAGIVCNREARLLDVAGVAALVVEECPPDGVRVVDGLADRLGVRDGAALGDGTGDWLADADGVVEPVSPDAEVPAGIKPASPALLRAEDPQEVSPSPPSSTTARAPTAVRPSGVRIRTPPSGRRSQAA
ncbi:hypothetical protein Raf01_12090 [Rugosimonospora africana]|uniref:Uncharacterized protein n=1 Tax=Rugosimonospora africana TaxID=556532 RepID=A0A8J3QN51_9ACTN|nr:hypothetical protein Raf01_12090 [Rugosimonospora africana]